MSTLLFNEFVSVIYGGNQSKAAAALEVDRSMVSRLCAGYRGISPAIAEKIESVSAGRFEKGRFIWPATKAESA